MKFPSLNIFGRRSVPEAAPAASPSTEVKPPEVQAATKYPDPAPPKTKPKQQVLPSHLTSAKPDPKSALPFTDRRFYEMDLTSLRAGQGTREVISDFIKASPDLSAAVAAYIRVGITKGYRAVARDLDGTFSREGTAALQQTLTRLNVLSDYEVGYDDAPSIRTLSETLAMELMHNGGMAAELVLDKSLLPWKIQPISFAQIEFYPADGGRRLIPKQRIAGNNIDLDIPTFFTTVLDQRTRDVYPSSPMEPSIQPVLFNVQLMNDLRRVVRRAIYPRMDVTLEMEQFQKSIPPELSVDKAAANEYLNQLVAGIQESVNSLQPEDAMVHFDSVKVDVVDHGNTNLGKELEVVQDMADSKLATGAKVLPTVLGHSSGTSNVASSEVLMFMKYVEGTVWAKLNEMLSKILTLAVRLLGHNVYVEFRYEAIDLRPESELEAFKAMKQSRLLELLSLGMITDESACLELTGELPPAGYTNKSGTGFRANTGGVQPAGDGYNGASNSGSTMNQNLNPQTPTQPKSQNRRAAEGNVIPIADQP